MTSWLLRRSEEWGKPAVLSRQLGPQPDGHDQVCDLIPRIAALLDSTGTIEFTDEPGEDPPITGPSLWGPRMTYMPTKLRWHGSQDRLIAYQFDGRSGADAKNPSERDVYKIQHRLFFGGMIPMAVGLPWTVEQSVIILAACRQFIGVCSGLSHVAHSVGCPMILVRYRLRFERWHPDPLGANPWTLAEGTDDAIAKLVEALQ